MAKELYDGIYSSHKLVFIERIERNLKFYLKDKLIYIKKLGQELFCVVDRDNLKEVIGEIKENPEISTEVLNSINLFESKDGYCILVDLSSVTNNYSMILKVLLHSASYGNAKKDLRDIISVIKMFYKSAESYQAVTFSEDENFDARIINQPIDGMDCFDTYISISNEKIEQVYFDTSISGVLNEGLFKDSKLTDPLVYLSRFDFSGGIFPEIIYCNAIEELLQLKIPKRVQYIRMLLGELFRISSHLYFLSKINRILGYDFGYNQALIEREKTLRLIEVVTGARVHPNFIRIGGLKNDLDTECIYNIRENIKGIYKKANNLETLMMDNPVITAKLRDIGVADRETAIECGATGPNLRASGARYDFRKNRNLLLYKDVSFLIPAGSYGDCLDRVQLRFREIYQSIIIISQIVKSLPEEYIKKIMDLRELDLPFSEMTSSIECPHGVLKIFLEAEGDKILNLVLMGPSRNSLYLAEKIIPGSEFDNLEMILTSFDINCGEIIHK